MYFTSFLQIHFFDSLFNKGKNKEKTTGYDEYFKFVN